MVVNTSPAHALTIVWCLGLQDPFLLVCQNKNYMTNFVQLFSNCDPLPVKIISDIVCVSFVFASHYCTRLQHCCIIQALTHDWSHIPTHCTLSLFYNNYSQAPKYLDRDTRFVILAVYAVWLNLSRKCIPVHFRIHYASSLFCHIFNKHK